MLDHGNWSGLRFRCRLVRKIKSCEAASAELERLDALWEGLNVSRDNKALVLARDGTIINLNQLAANLSGRRLHDMLGTSIGELLEIPSSERSVAIECRKTTLKAASGEAIAVEVTRQTLGARIRNLEVYAIRDLRERHATAERLARQGELLLRHEGDLEAQNARFEMTVNNMAQGVCLFGPDQRVVIANRRYAEIYGLTAEQVQRGTALRQILEARAAMGVYGDVGARKMVEEGVQSFAERVSGVVRLPDGRIISVLRLPMADGSLLSTHEDITEREELNARLAEQHERLDAALENMLQGLAMFDAEQRLIVCNRRYRDMYGLTCDQVKPGTTVRADSAISHRQRILSCP